MAQDFFLDLLEPAGLVNHMIVPTQDKGSTFDLTITMKDCDLEVPDVSKKVPLLIGQSEKNDRISGLSET